MSPGADYLSRSRRLVETVEAQLPEIRMAARLFADTILAGRMVHLFGSGHSRILVEEMWPRYGSFPGFNPIVELSLSFHNMVVGANGQRQAMFLENVSGLAARILRNYDLSPIDTALVASSSGCNIVPIEMAEEFRRRRVRVVAIISKQHSEKSQSKRADGKKLQDFAEIVLDTGAPVGDAMVRIPGLETPVSPGSTVGGCLLVNAIKAEVADRLTRAGKPPLVLTAGAVVGTEKATQLFEGAYDEHSRRLARLYAELGAKPGPAPAPAPARDRSDQSDRTDRTNRTDRTDPPRAAEARFLRAEPRPRREPEERLAAGAVAWSPGSAERPLPASSSSRDRPVMRRSQGNRSYSR